ncbi:hypothetical protein TCAL_10370 [Tigriopus californicus]|uniref:Palmitoyl-protein thioesterase 1 n=1 Tax=Tigriopus californicus TaxID=6832 RepID=A0A553PSE3_TIGCA|nr:palmitoyl-protein thioesterase 1-like [Tigriopus californicus]TRY80595.1 hypothetical protein TCAL_10370 [Tigriopus californicus]
MRWVSLLGAIGVLGSVHGAGTPVVIWHGMGDSCCRPTSMGRIQELIENGTQPGTYVHSLMIGDNTLDDTINTFLKPVNEQVQEVCDYVAQDPALADGYHAIGFSQGGQFLRAVAQRCPSPPIKNLVTLGAQHQGVYGFPRCPGESVELCNLMRELLNYGAYTDLVQDILVQAQYWHDPLHFETYVEKSQFIGEINNEGPVKNLTYAENMAKLEKFVLIKFAEDRTVEPVESQFFEFYQPGSEYDILPLRESPIYTEDRVGLKALDLAGKLEFLTIEGSDHMQIPTQWFMDNVVANFLQ